MSRSSEIHCPACRKPMVIRGGALADAFVVCPSCQHRFRLTDCDDVDAEHNPGESSVIDDPFAQEANVESAPVADEPEWGDVWDQAEDGAAPIDFGDESQQPEFQLPPVQTSSTRREGRRRQRNVSEAAVQRPATSRSTDRRTIVAVLSLSALVLMAAMGTAIWYGMRRMGAGQATSHSAERDLRTELALSELGIAWRKYERDVGTFPVGPPRLTGMTSHYDSSGRPLLSWRVHLLPFMGQEQLYRQFRADEPWDSEHNLRMLEKMPTVYGTAEDGLPTGYTVIQAVTGVGTMNE
ncbi:MAG: DUF1559 domain-containing protein, partial [Planctomycetaceae bacterium]|nr:DUF1559 domain-containing protein [Planctomycetaceae bacterium]